MMSKDRTEFITDRMFIKEVTLEDVYDIHQLHSLPETDQFNTLGIPESISVTSDYLISSTGLKIIKRSYLPSLIIK